MGSRASVWQLHRVCIPPTSVFNFASKVFLTIVILTVFIKQVNPAAIQPIKTNACSCTENPDSTSHKWWQSRTGTRSYLGETEWHGKAISIEVDLYRAVIDNHDLRDPVFLYLESNESFIMAFPSVVLKHWGGGGWKKLHDLLLPLPSLTAGRCDSSHL